MKKVIALIFSAALLLALSACGNGANQPEQRIAGRWESVAVGATEFQAMEFIPHSDDPQRGQVHLRMLSNEISGAYEITPGDEQHRLTITYTLTMFPTTREFSFAVEDDSLVLQEEGAAEGLAYRRSAE